MEEEAKQGAEQAIATDGTAEETAAEDNGVRDDGDRPEAKGRPDAAKAQAKRDLKQQRDEAREENRKLREDIEQLQKTVDASERRARTAMLKAAGCIDVDVALGIMQGDDVDGLKASKPYLFQQAGTTGLKPEAAPRYADDFDSKLREVMGLRKQGA